ncbi:MAG: hypothetical protein HQM03_11305 [Magnetococcales bacterium]|nr:hypothetical protein [Magnetococcales bacterium]
MKAEMSRDGKTIVVTIPMLMKRRGGRKLIIAPPGMEETARPRDETLAKLVAKAHRWLRQLESGQCASMRAIAEQEKIDESYVAKVLRLTMLAPDIIEAILNDRHPDVLTWRELAKPFPMEWERQREVWGIGTPPAQSH